jgi:dodecin
MANSSRHRLAGPKKGAHDAEMTDHVYRVTEVVGSSETGVDDAIRKGVSRAAQTLREVDWFEVTEIRGHVENGELAHFQVGLKIGFRLEDT